MDEIQIDLWVRHDLEQKPSVFNVSGSAADIFLPKMLAELQRNGIDPQTITSLGTAISYIENEEALYFLVDGDETFADMVRVFGESLTAQPPVLEIGTAGLGGGPVIYEIIKLALQNEPVTWGLAAYGLAGAIRDSLRFARYVKYRDSRDALRESNIRGHVTDQLRNLVVEPGFWATSDFRRQFDVDDRRAAEILRACGFEPVPQSSHDEVWIIPDQPLTK